MGKMAICAMCKRPIGGPGSAENVAVVRLVRLVDGRAGWVSVHVRCARGPWPRLAAERQPAGRPLALEGVRR